MPQTIEKNKDETAEDVELLSPHEKCLVLGSVGYTGIDAVEWDAEDLPNIESWGRPLHLQF